QAFHQADSTLNRRFGGTGLGLSISNSLAEHLGGELQVKSKVGEGSRFALVLPQQCQLEATPRHKREPLESVSPDVMRGISPVLPQGDESSQGAPGLQ